MLLGEQRGVDEILVSLDARYPSEEEQTETEEWTAFDYLPSHGMWIALATFVPTFLAVVIGVPHVLTSALVRHTTEPRVAVASRSATTAWAAPTGWSADWRPVFLATSSPSEMGERGRSTTLVDDAPTPQPSLETTDLAASPKPTTIRPKAPSAQRPRTAPGLRQPPFRTTKRRPGSRARCATRDIVWTCVMKTLPRGHG